MPKNKKVDRFSQFNPMEQTILRVLLNHHINTVSHIALFGMYPEGKVGNYLAALEELENEMNQVTVAPKEMNEPNPGSDEALDKGCICPVLDNHHGKGFNGGHFWITHGCPIHMPAEDSTAGRTADKYYETEFDSRRDNELPDNP